MRPEILEKLVQSKNLHQVNLANLNITDDEIQEIFDKIREIKPQATEYDFDCNHITDKGAHILSQNLRDCDQLSSLSIQFNGIDTDGAMDLFSLKQKFPNLQILFHGNRIINVSEMAEIEKSALGNIGFRPTK